MPFSAATGATDAACDPAEQRQRSEQGAHAPGDERNGLVTGDGAQARSPGCPPEAVRAVPGHCNFRRAGAVRDAVHIVLRDGLGTGGLFTDSRAGAWLLSLSDRSVCACRRRRDHCNLPIMTRAPRLAGLLAALAIGAATLAGCTAPGLILTAAGIATDTSVTWEVVEHRPCPAHRRRSDALRDAQQRAARAQRPLRVRSRQHPPRPTLPEAACRPAHSPPRRATHACGVPCPS